jgi:hypothetical protein
LPEAYPAEFRQRVLRRLAEKEDLGATAREFGLSADLIFSWLKESADGGERVASAGAASPRQRRATAAGPSRPAGEGTWRLGVGFYASLFIPFFLLLAFGHVRPSVQAGRDCLPIWIALGVGVFAWLMRLMNRDLEASGLDLPLGRWCGVVMMLAVISALSAWLLSLALPAIPHRWISQPVEVRTVVTSKVVNHGKHISYCLQTPAFDARIEPFEWCTGYQTFLEAKVGETIVLHGSTSWFGFLDNHFDLVPAAPGGASGVAGPGLADQGRPAMTTRSEPAPMPRVAPFPVAARMPAPGAAGPVGEVQAPLVDEPLLAWPGDDLATLQAAYPGRPAPEPYHSGDPANQQALWLRDHGLRFFLTSDGTVNAVRLDRPFGGRVDGVRIGDALDEVRDKLGSEGTVLGDMPGRRALAGSYLFSPGTGYRIRVDLDAGQRVQTIFLTR